MKIVIYNSGWEAGVGEKQCWGWIFISNLFSSRINQKIESCDRLLLCSASVYLP